MLRSFLLSSALLAAGGCATVDPAGGPSNPVSRTSSSDQINWPTEYRPEEADFYIRNEIDIAAPPEVIWDILIQAETWPDWYEGAAGVEVRSADDGRLASDAVFAWKTMGLNFESVVKEWEPPYRLSWESRKRTIVGYHAWLIVPTPSGARLITDESQHGLLANMQKLFMPNKLRRLHDRWLEAIKLKAESAVSNPS